VAPRRSSGRYARRLGASCRGGGVEGQPSTWELRCLPRRRTRAPPWPVPPSAAPLRSPSAAPFWARALLSPPHLRACGGLECSLVQVCPFNQPAHWCGHVCGQEGGCDSSHQQKSNAAQQPLRAERALDSPPMAEPQLPMVAACSASSGPQEGVGPPGDQRCAEDQHQHAVRQAQAPPAWLPLRLLPVSLRGTEAAPASSLQDSQLRASASHQAGQPLRQEGEMPPPQPGRPEAGHDGGRLQAGLLPGRGSRRRSVGGGGAPCWAVGRRRSPEELRLAAGPRTARAMRA